MAVISGTPLIAYITERMAFDVEKSNRAVGQVSPCCWLRGPPTYLLVEIYYRLLRAHPISPNLDQDRGLGSCLVVPSSLTDSALSVS